MMWTIIGFGRTGHYLAQEIENIGGAWFGTKRQENKEAGIKSLDLSSIDTLPSMEELSQLFEGRVVVFLIPPSSYHSEVFQYLCNNLKTSAQLFVQVSSTSIFEKNHGEVFDETLPEFESERAKKVFEAENLFVDLAQSQSCPHFRIRSSGLFDDQNHPAYFLNKKEEISFTDKERLSLIHRRELARVILWVKENFADLPSVLNASYPTSQTKYHYYENLFKTLGLKSQLKVIPDNSSWRHIVPKLLINSGFKFQNDPNGFKA
ncbi:MAG: hypothetical protein ACPGJV_05930 [Bacteriovoracaceae bacterium]